MCLYVQEYMKVKKHYGKTISVCEDQTECLQTQSTAPDTPHPDRP